MGETLDGMLGIEWIEVGPDGAVARVEIGDRHRQPYGIVHGGTYCTIVESLASTAAAVWALANGKAGVVGISNTTDFLRSHREGPVRAEATAVHRGRTQQLWQVVVTSEDTDKVLARGQVRLQNLDDPGVIGGLGDPARHPPLGPS